MSPVNAVLFDRDGTLVHDVPYNADPARVRPVDGARAALDALRARGIRTGVVTNQSGIARGLLTEADAHRVNRRVDELLGPFDVWALCPHGPDDGCPCRKPRPGMVLWAAGRIGAAPADCVVIGDIGADMEAARRAGAHGILVPTPQTRPEETAAAPHVAPDLPAAVRLVLDTPPWGRAPLTPPPSGPGARDGTPPAATRISGPAPQRAVPVTEGGGDRSTAASARGGTGHRTGDAEPRGRAT
ncbi:HAD-IIIA family hydrolase [Streptomyces pilosus]|uniref:D-glycero-alpha-D-manno-heptose-1,7-bisphosphate 7-phosphatase n=1 Tax=Streptomyces pilosus TaxID=28893 RepID=UPI001675B583|nr:HAD family hydrolase [Streptomyces pilosus]GGV43024.1 dehydratase [Streptomyces pilosus]